MPNDRRHSFLHPFDLFFIYESTPLCKKDDFAGSRPITSPLGTPFPSYSELQLLLTLETLPFLFVSILYN